MRARHRLGKFLLRREIYYESPGEPWSLKHRAWLASLRFADRASQLTIADYLHAHDVLIARRDRVENELATLAGESRCSETVARLRCLRGAQTRPPQAQRRCRRRDRPRADRVLLGDRHSSGSRSAGIRADRRPPHARNPRPAEADNDHRAQKDQHLTLTTDQSTTRCGWRGGPGRSPASRTPVRGVPMSNHSPAVALENRQRTCDENKVLGYPAPGYEADHRRDTRGPPDRPASRNHTLLFRHQRLPLPINAPP
jgi:hypothetical protein